MSLKIKITKWNSKKIYKKLDSASLKALKSLAKETQKEIKSEVPVDTGNLRDSQIIGDIGEVGNKIAVNVGSDHDKAPYDIFVYYPGITRRYSGNDWLWRSMINLKKKKKELLSQLSTFYRNIDD